MSDNKMSLTIHETQDRSAMTLAFEPHDLTSAMQLADVLSRSKLMPASLRNPADILIVVMTGRELGLTTMQSVRGMHVIDGKVGMSAELILALVKKRAECEYLRVVESTDSVCTLETKRKGDPEPTRMSYTIEQARRAGVTGKDNWRKHTEAMLRARCASAICRVVYPDLLLGVYSDDEMDEIRDGRQPRQVVDAVVVDESAMRALVNRIAATSSLAELDALVPEIQAAGLPADQMNVLRSGYGMRKKALLAEEAARVADIIDAQDGDAKEPE